MSIREPRTMDMDAFWRAMKERMPPEFTPEMERKYYADMVIQLQATQALIDEAREEGCDDDEILRRLVQARDAAYEDHADLAAIYLERHPDEVARPWFNPPKS